jgi:prepilin peptidase CpaA
MADQYAIHVVILTIAGAVMVSAALSDVRTYRIPNYYSVVLAGLFPLHVWLSPVAISVTSCLLAAVIVFAVAIVFYALKRLGVGDVKLMSVIALWAGLVLLDDFVVVMTLAGGVLSLIYITHFHVVPALGFDHAGPSGTNDNPLAAKLPYGVAIAAGGLVVLFNLAP